MVIDDEESILDVIKIVLESGNYEALVYTKAPTLIEIERLNPNLIFLDLLLKNANGKDICMSIKNTISTKHIPVVMISAHTKQLIESVTESAGANGFITKPFDIEELMNIVEKHVV